MEVNETLLIKSVLDVEGGIRYNIKLKKEKSWKRLIHLFSGIISGIVVGGLTIYKINTLNKQRY